MAFEHTDPAAPKHLSIEDSQTVGDYFLERDIGEGDLMIVPGTNDRSASSLLAWTDFIVRRFPEHSRHIVDYPATIGPIIGGLRAPKYDQSKNIAVERGRELITRAKGRVTLLGYSQGADAVWETAVQSVDNGEINPEDLQVLLVGYPRLPEALKDAMSKRHRIVSSLFKTAFRAEMDGAWQIDPRIEVTSIAINGDPITLFPRVRPNPLRSSAELIAGYFMVHGGLGHESAAQLEKLSIESIGTVPDSKTTYITAAATNPIVQARAFIKERRQRNVH